MSGMLKGPLPVLVIAAAVYLVVRYVPLGDVVERVKQGMGTEQEAPPAPPPQASVANDSDGVPAASDAPAVTAPQPPMPIDTRLPDAVVAELAAASDSDAGPAPAPIVRSTPAAAPEVQAPPRDEVGERAVVATVGKRDTVATPPPAPPVVQASVADVTKETRPPVTRTAPRPPPQEPPAPPAPTMPELRILVEAETDHRADTGKYTPAVYAGMLRDELRTVVRDYLGAASVADDVGNAAFGDDLADGRAGVEHLCERAGARRLLLADVEVPSAGFSSIASAYWPEVVFTAINCADGRLHKSTRQRLEPHRLDRFEYQYQFARRAEQFVASQGYFLKP